MIEIHVVFGVFNSAYIYTHFTTMHAFDSINFMQLQTSSIDGSYIILENCLKNLLRDVTHPILYICIMRGF